MSFVLLLAPARARGQSPDDPTNAKARAEALYDEAKKLFENSQFEIACPKFKESQRLDPTAGTAYALAACHEATGRLASAWASYREAARLYREKKDETWQHDARTHHEALEPRLVRVILQVPPPARLAGLEVRLDGEAIGPSSWTVALPVDPGEHAVAATAPGHDPWQKTFSVAGDGVTETIEVPVLASRPLPPPLPPPAASAPPLPLPPTWAPRAAVPSSPPADKSSRGSGQRIASYVVGAAGIVGLGLGIGFGVHARNLYSASLDACGGEDPKSCPNEPLGNGIGHDQRSTAGTYADASTAAFVIGGLAVAGGITLFFTAPKSRPPVRSGRTAPALTTSPGFVRVELGGCW
jgi:serine/threonine-protein kinase